MAIRSNMIGFTFDPASPRITAHSIHEWLLEEMHIQEQKAHMIQIDGNKRQVYIKLTDKDYMLSIINGTGGRGEYKQNTGEISLVEIAVAGMGHKKIRITNLPPEVLDDTNLLPHLDKFWTFKMRCGRGPTGTPSLTASGRLPCCSHNLYHRI